MNPALTIPAFGPVLPEILMATGALVLVLFGAFRGERAGYGMSIIALALIAVTFVAVLMLPSERVETMAGSFVVDGLANLIKALTHHT